MLIKNERTITNELKYLFSNKLYLISLILITVACYGFTITHLSLGIDDFGTYHYLDLSPDSIRNMLQQGRLLHILFYYVFGLATVNPFINNLIAALLFSLSAAVFCALIRVVSEERFGAIELALFSCIYVSCSVTSFKFIYDIDVVVTYLSYLAIPLSIYLFCKCVQNKSIKYLIGNVLCLLVGISSYESFITVFILEVLVLLIISHVLCGMKAGEVFKCGFALAGDLCVAAGIYYACVFVIQRITDNIPIKQHSLLDSENKLSTILGIIRDSFLRHELFFVIEFAVFTAVFILVMLVYVFAKKKPLCLLLFPACGLFVMLIPFIHGLAHYRTYQTMPVFIACSALLAIDLFKDRVLIKRCAVGALCLVILWSVVDINRWFYRDWINYQKNVYAIHKIATDLQEGYDVEHKPVCFTNRNYDSFIMTWDDGIQYEIGESPLVAAVDFLGDNNSRAVIALFEYQGYEFLLEPTIDQANIAQALSKDMPSYPKKGYIIETDEIIVVNIGYYGWWE